ncbi:hypothetical protein SAMN05443247_01317 [Bradyrhizobium erythrophlei]|jgi:hypothetical protein|nr:hypothetical protein SAMN05443247_01317 [Bradyrhizobium erythrophlei]
MDDRFAAAVGVAIIVGIVWWVLNSRYQAGRLAGIREATADISRACSYHYEVKDQPLPEKVEKALDYMAGALKRGKGDKGKGDLYTLGAATLGDAMGEAAWQKGFAAGQEWTDPRAGELRVDMPKDYWRRIQYLAHIGFQHQMPNYERMIHFPFEREDDAMESERAIEKLEYAINHRESDPEYSDSLSRNMLIWQQWPSEAPADKAGRKA